MEQDTRDFISALCAPFKAEKKVLTKHPDNPKPVEETIVVEEQVTLKIIKLEEKNIYWKK